MIGIPRRRHGAYLPPRDLADETREMHAAWQASGPDELASIRRACGDCGAPAYRLCYSPTGLPASAPCPSRGGGR